MSTHRKTYTREFKVEAVRLTYENDTSVEQLAADLGVSSSSLHSVQRSYVRTASQSGVSTPRCDDATGSLAPRVCGR